ncbi:MAG: hypothetical protein ACTSRP_17295 [Candidatus Helarchaeota archaeon]
MNIIFILYKDKIIKVWDKNTFREIATLREYSYCVGSLIVDGQFICSSFKDKVILMWDKRKHKKDVIIKESKGGLQ